MAEDFNGTLAKIAKEAQRINFIFAEI